MTGNVHPIRPALALELEAQMSRLGLSQNKVADLLDVSSTAISQWRRGKYPGDVPALEARVRKWLDTGEELEGRSLDAARLDKHLALQVTGEIGWLLTHAQATADIVLVKGASGSGKSWAADHYCRTHSATYYVPMTRTVRTLTGLLTRVSNAIGGFADTRSAQAAEDTVVERLQGRRALLVIDEAHHLTPTLLDELRCIRDLAKCGLALIGDRTIAMRLAQCPQIVGRIADTVEKDGPCVADVELLVSGFLERPARRDEVRLGLAAAAGDGGLHALRRMLARAWMLARIEERDAVTVADLELATWPAGPAWDGEEAA